MSRICPAASRTLRDYEQPPAPPAEFVTSPLYLNLRGRVYPELLRTFVELFSGAYQEAALCWGIGAGKSFFSSLAISYLVHRTLCLRDPQAHYGLAPGTTIAFMNMGASATQAQRVVFSEIRRRLTDSPWFQRYCAAREFKLEPRSGEVRLPKHLAVVTGNSAETCPLGYNLLGAVMDEAAWMVETADGRRDVAEEVYHALARRIHSRFLDRGLLVLISSPRHVGDFIERKLQEARINPTLYASRRALWEVKPPGIYSGQTFEFQGLQVPVEYRADFERNPQRALRDLAARPTEAFCAYFADEQAVRACVDADRPLPMDETGRWREDFRAPDRLPRFVHVDLGLRHDACGLAMAHCRPDPARPAEPQVHVDLALRLPAPRGGEIDFARVRELIGDLRRRGFHLAQVSFDGWQSVDSRQILRRQGIPTRLVSVDRDLSAYETLKELIHTGRVSLPAYEPLLAELRRLELVRGVKVDHPPGGSKDCADAVAAAASEALRAGATGGVGGRVV